MLPESSTNLTFLHNPPSPNRSSFRSEHVKIFDHASSCRPPVVAVGHRGLECHCQVDQEQQRLSTQAGPHVRTRGRGNKNVRLFPKREEGTSCRWVSTALHKGEGREETPPTDTHGNTDTTLSFPLSLWGICTHPASSPHRSAPGTWRDDKYCKACNQQATIGASNSVTVQAGGCSGQSLVKVAEFTTWSATIFQPLYATSDVTVAGDMSGAHAKPHRVSNGSTDTGAL